MPVPALAQGAPLIGNATHLAAVHDGMVAVMHGPTGTARRVGANAPYQIAGKSGTAQRVTSAKRSASGNLNAPESFRNQALFMAYAPAAQPTIAVVVVVEHGESGSRAAGPIARHILDVYLLGAAAPPWVSPVPASAASAPLAPAAEVKPIAEPAR